MKPLITIFILCLFFISHAQDYKIDCTDSVTVICKDSISWPQRQKGNIFYGCWQTIIDSNYTELFFTNDSVYSYDKNGRDNKILNYTFTDTIITFIDNSGEKTTCRYIVENMNTMRFNCSFNFIWRNDTTVYHPAFILQRIDNQYYTFDKVNCWGVFEKETGCLNPSKDAVKFKNAFFKRMVAYLPKQ